MSARRAHGGKRAEGQGGRQADRQAGREEGRERGRWDSDNAAPMEAPIHPLPTPLKAILKLVSSHLSPLYNSLAHCKQLPPSNPASITSFFNAI